jgi:hypothetical protein
VKGVDAVFGPTSLLSAGDGDDESAAGAAYIMVTE